MKKKVSSKDDEKQTHKKKVSGEDKDSAKKVSSKDEK